MGGERGGLRGQPWRRGGAAQTQGPGCGKAGSQGFVSQWNEMTTHQGRETKEVQRGGQFWVNKLNMRFLRDTVVSGELGTTWKKVNKTGAISTHFFLLVCSANHSHQGTESTHNAGDMGLHWRFPWRKKQQPAPVFLPGKLHGRRNLAGYSLGGHERVGHDWACTGTLS